MTLVTNMTQSTGGEPMPDNGQSPRATLNPTALPVQDTARLLTTVGGQPVSEAMLELDIAEGAPTNADGTLNLVHYAAWLVKEMAGGD
jgi:hypothetical protein